MPITPLSDNDAPTTIDRRGLFNRLALGVAAAAVAAPSLASAAESVCGDDASFAFTASKLSKPNFGGPASTGISAGAARAKAFAAARPFGVGRSLVSLQKDGAVVTEAETELSRIALVQVPDACGLQVELEVGGFEAVSKTTGLLTDAIKSGTVFVLQFGLEGEYAAAVKVKSASASAVAFDAVTGAPTAHTVRCTYTYTPTDQSKGTAGYYTYTPTDQSKGAAGY